MSVNNEILAPCRECGGEVAPDAEGFVQRTIDGGMMCWPCVRRDGALRDERRVRETLRHYGDERLLDAILAARDAEIERLRAALEWFADEGHYSDTYRHGAGFVDALGETKARAALLGMSDDDADAVGEAWAKARGA